MSEYKSADVKTYAASMTHLPTTERSLPIALVRAREKVMSPIRDMLLDSGITEQQWRVLRVLSERGPLNASQLADQACLLQPSLTRIVQAMLEKGLVTRVTHRQDRRRLTVSITAEGQQIIENNLEQAVAISERFVEVLGHAELESLLDSLQKLDAL